MTADAPGWPGIAPKWTSSAKSGVGTALNSVSRVWFTLSHGIINEVYYPRVDQACIRDLQLLVTDGGTSSWEEKRDLTSFEHVHPSGAPAYLVESSEPTGRFSIRKEIVTDPVRDVLMQRIWFHLDDTGSSYEVYALLAPHLGNRGWENSAFVGDYKGHPMLFAQRNGIALALACNRGWTVRSAGFVGFSDGWQDLTRHRTLTWKFDRAENGNVALIGQFDWKGEGDVVLTLGFGQSIQEAGQRALASMEDGFDNAWTRYCEEWDAWLSRLRPTEPADHLARISQMVLRAHESKRFPGGVIASLSIPWGMSKGDDDLGGYHLVWPRDLVETAGAMLAIGAVDDAIRVAGYLQSTQEADGHWAQNMWLDGAPYWGGVQMDETAFPILLVDLLRRHLDWQDEWQRFWPMVRQAASYLVCNGPVTQQDRWEEDPGYSPFTLAVEVAALLAAAELADSADEPMIAAYLRETADSWNEGVEYWTYVTDTPLAHDVGVDGYYVRIAPPDEAECRSPKDGFVPIKNRPPGDTGHRAGEIVSPDALALVRFGLRRADDPRIRNTVKVIDHLLRHEFATGPAWYRYNGDGYGEHEDGSPFDGTGIGRPWPLLTGERAHYELAAGNVPEARRLAAAFASFAGVGGMLPEQVWDADDRPGHGLISGRPNGSAMPLVWAHAEYLKLTRSLADSRVFDMPPQPVARYPGPQAPVAHVIWRYNHKCRVLPAGRILRIELLSPARVRWSCDDWRTVRDEQTRATGLGVHLIDLPTSELAPGAAVDFTMYWTASDNWEGADFRVDVSAAS